MSKHYALRMFELLKCKGVKNITKGYSNKK